MAQVSLMPAEVIHAIESSVLCWLATVSKDGIPNVSPKEAFLYDGQGKIVVAHIASPVTVRNIESTGKACASFLDVFIQKGVKIDCSARIVREGDERFPDQLKMLRESIGERFPIKAIIELQPTSVSAIIAPSYCLFPETKERDMMKSSLRSYRVEEIQRQVDP